MDYLVRFVQLHESFRKAELEALADLYGINMDFLHYDQYVRTLLHVRLLAVSQPCPSMNEAFALTDGLKIDLRPDSPLYCPLAR